VNNKINLKYLCWVWRVGHCKSCNILVTLMLLLWDQGLFGTKVQHNIAPFQIWEHIYSCIYVQLHVAGGCHCTLCRSVSFQHECLDTCMMLHLRTLNSICQVVAQFVKVSKSRCKIVWSSGKLIVLYSAFISKLDRQSLIPFILLIYMRKESKDIATYIHTNTQNYNQIYSYG